MAVKSQSAARKTAVRAERKDKPIRNIVQVDMGEQKAAFEAYCKERGVTVSQMTRSLLLGAMAGQPAGVEAVVGKKSAKGTGRAPAAGQPQRREIQFSAQEDAELVARAKRLGFTIQAYVIGLVRAHLTNEAQLGRAELQALGASNETLVSLVQQLRRGSAPAAVDIANQVQAHLKDVRAMIVRNQERWL